MTVKSRKFTKGIRLKATDDAATLDGEIRNDKTDEKLKVNLEGAEKEIVTDDQSQTLTNKIIDGNDNTITNVSAGSIGNLVEDLSVPENAHDSIPSALAVQEYVENTSAASSSDLIYHMSDKSTHGTQSDIVGKDDNQELTNKTIDSASNTITVDADTASVSNLETDNFKAGVVDTDGTLLADSDSKIASQKAVKAYVDNATSGIVSDASAVTYTPDDPSNWQQTHNNVADPLDEIAVRAFTVESQFNDHLYTSGDKHNSEEIVYDNTVSSMLADNVKDALDELKQDIGSGAATDITYDDTVTGLGSNVQLALDQLHQDVANAGNDVQAHNSFYVCENSGDDLNPGTLLQPFATIQKAINEVVASGLGGSSAVINVDYGFYVENLILAEAYNIMIIGKGMTDTQNCWIEGTIDLTNSENIKFKNFRIDPPTPSAAIPTIKISKTTPSNNLVVGGGRHIFESCVIHNDAVGGISLQLAGGTSQFNVFRECTFVGSLDLTPPSFLGASVSLIECSSETAPITVDNSILTAVDCYSIGHVTHLSGIVALKDIHTMERVSDACIDSTAAFVPGFNVIYLEDISTFDLAFAGTATEYGQINIASCSYALNSCSRNPSVDTITGSRFTMGQRSQDIAYDNTDSVLTTSDVKSALDEVAGLLGSGADALNSATTTVDVSSATAPTAGQVLTATSDTAATWQTPAAGGGGGVDIQQSSIINVFSSSNQFHTQVTNSNVTIVSDGSPIQISLMGRTGTTNESGIWLGNTSGSNDFESFFIHLYQQVDAGANGEVGRSQVGGYIEAGQYSITLAPNSVSWYIPSPPVGTLTFRLYVSCLGLNTLIDIRHSYLVAKKY